jgi:hypothetical protein
VDLEDFMQFSLTNSSAYFKEKYLKVSENVYNSANVTLGRVKKTYDFTGKQTTRAIPQSFNGGVGSGRLPTASYDMANDAILTAKKVYSVVEIEREAIKAADGRDGSFVAQTKHTVAKGVESWMRNMSRILWNDLDNGQLGVGDGSTAVTGDGSSGTPYVVVMSATGWKEANWEERDGVNCGTETSLLTVSEVVPSSRTVKFIGTSATLAAAVAGATFTTAKFYMQNSKDNDPLSIAGVLAATSSTLYSISVTRRWQASVQANATSAGLTTDMMNTDMLEIQRKCGKVPNLIVTSFKQYGKLLNLLEDQKEYIVEPRAADLKGKISFSGLAFHSAAGLVPIFPERFVADDRIYYINDNFIEILHRPDFGWFDDDGTVFLRKADDDAYEARYGGYLQVYCAPNFHGYRYGLA